MIIICGKTYYNLEEAVGRLTQLIGRATDVVKQIRGQVDTYADLPQVTSVNVGDTYAIGTAAPYQYYVALANGWLDLGTFPLKGDPGTAGTDGRSIWYSTFESDNRLAEVGRNTIYNPDDITINAGDLLITPAGDLYSVTGITPDVIYLSYRIALKGEPGEGDGGTDITEYDLEDLTASAMPEYDIASDVNTVIVYAGTAYRYYSESIIPGTGYSEIIYTASDAGQLDRLVLRYSTAGAAQSVTASSRTAQTRISNIDLLGTADTVSYDTTDGMNVTGSGAIRDTIGTTQNITAEITLPIFPGDNVTIDENEDGTGIVINATGGGSGDSTVYELSALTASAMPDYQTAHNAATLIHYSDYWYAFAGEEGDGAGSYTMIYKAITGYASNAEYVDYLILYYEPVTFAAHSISNASAVVGAAGVTPSGATEEAASGTLTAGEFAILNASPSNYIIFNKECYYLADNEHTTGILTYTHVGYNGDTGAIKYFNITKSTRAWTLTTWTPPQMSLDTDTATLTITGV